MVSTGVERGFGAELRLWLGRTLSRPGGTRAPLCPSVRARRDGGVAEQHRDRVDDGVVYREDKLTVPQFAPIVSASAQGQ